jgi:hypothetical protein
MATSSVVVRFYIHWQWTKRIATYRLMIAAHLPHNNCFNFQKKCEVEKILRFSNGKNNVLPVATNNSTTQDLTLSLCHFNLNQTLRSHFKSTYMIPILLSFQTLLNALARFSESSSLGLSWPCAFHRKSTYSLCMQPNHNGLQPNKSFIQSPGITWKSEDCMPFLS